MNIFLFVHPLVNVTKMSSIVKRVPLRSSAIDLNAANSNVWMTTNPMMHPIAATSNVWNINAWMTISLVRSSNAQTINVLTISNPALTTTERGRVSNLIVKTIHV